MIFWVAAAALTAITVWLAVAAAVGSVRQVDGGSEADVVASVYRRQFTEIADLAEAGLLDLHERKAALAEAGRRLLSTRTQVGNVGISSQASACVLIASLAIAAGAALALYWAIGAPGRTDEPYIARLQQWRTSDLSTLDAPKVAALLGEVAKTKPNDATLQLYLGRAHLQAGDFFAAADNFRRATRLTPKNAEAHRLLGEALFQASADRPPPLEADAAFARALQLDPGDVAARYFLAETAFRRGDLVAARQGWAGTKAMLSPGDPRLDFLNGRIAEAGRLVQGPVMDDNAITGMVSSLAGRLRTKPDDPEGWARLVRSYGVLGKRDEQQKALAAARSALSGRPADLAKVEAEASGGQAAPR